MLLEIIIILLITISIILQVKQRKSKTFTSQKAKNGVILDSCALIDGRIIELAKIGFLPDAIVIPSFILQELQLLADGKDNVKRERARFGLQIAKSLQQLESLNVAIDQTQPNKPTTDEKLVSLAKSLHYKLFTTDFNLNQVASIEGVTVLNINELAHALRPEILPGEEVKVSITQPGTNRNQGVGYLQDGTMIVIDDAQRDIGKVISVTITKSHQTVAGKMLFAKKVITTSQKKPFVKPKKVYRQNQ